MAKNNEAVQVVIDTTELLEAILVKLDTQTLLLSQRVNKQFKATIDDSPLLQKALFFRLAPRDGNRFGDEGVNTLVFDRKMRFGKGAYFRMKLKEAHCWDESDSDSEEDEASDDDDHSSESEGQDSDDSSDSTSSDSDSDSDEDSDLDDSEVSTDHSDFMSSESEDEDEEEDSDLDENEDDEEDSDLDDDEEIDVKYFDIKAHFYNYHRISIIHLTEGEQSWRRMHIIHPPHKSRVTKTSVSDKYGSWEQYEDYDDVYPEGAALQSIYYNCFQTAFDLQNYIDEKRDYEDDDDA